MKRRDRERVRARGTWRAEQRERETEPAERQTEPAERRQTGSHGARGAHARETHYSMHMMILHRPYMLTRSTRARETVQTTKINVCIQWLSFFSHCIFRLIECHFSEAFSDECGQYKTMHTVKC